MLLLGSASTALVVARAPLRACVTQNSSLPQVPLQPTPTPCRLATLLLLGMQPHLLARWVACCDFLRSCLVREALQSPSMLLLFPAQGIEHQP